MKLDVKNLVNSEVGQSEKIDLNLSAQKIDDDLFAERITGQIKLTKLEDEILARFEGEAKVKAVCDRCLTEFDLTEPYHFSQEYLLYGNPESGDEMGVSKQFEIDVTEPLRQELLAALPVKKLCKVDCAGLCVHCGTNLNEKKCSCDNKVK